MVRLRARAIGAGVGRRALLNRRAFQKSYDFCSLCLPACFW